MAFFFIVGISSYLTLTLIIKSEDTVIVPDFSGKDVVYVLEFLTELGLNTKVKGSEYNPTIPKNHVIYQEPEAGSEIKKGRDVKIIISKGIKTVVMPNLLSMSTQQARIILEENELCRGEIASVFHHHVEKDQVISHYPSPGKETEKGMCVDLLVSLGQRPKSYYMPELAGLLLEEAILLIEKNNLVQSKIQFEYDKDKPRNIILKQQPLAGHRVLEGSRVSLVMNRRQSSDEDDYLPGERPGYTFNYRLEQGFLKKRVHVQMNSDGMLFDLFDDYLKPGREVWLLIPPGTGSTVTLYVDNKLTKTIVYNN